MNTATVIDARRSIEHVIMTTEYIDAKVVAGAVNAATAKHLIKNSTKRQREAFATSRDTIPMTGEETKTRFIEQEVECLYHTQ